MKTALSALLTIISIAVLIQFSACASLKEAPDPVKVQDKVAEYRLQELELVRATITDPGRADRLIHLLGERDKLISESTEKIIAYRQQMTRLNANYHADIESFEALVTDFNSQRADGQKQYIVLFAAMKAETNSEEWEVISKFQMKRLHHHELTYGQAAGRD